MELAPPAALSAGAVSAGSSSTLLLTAIVFLVFAILLAVLLRHQRQSNSSLLAAHHLRRQSAQSRGAGTAHCWQEEPSHRLISRCCVCLETCLQAPVVAVTSIRGVERCQVCGISVHQECLRRASRDCKPVSLPADQPLQHHWIDGDSVVEDLPADEGDGCMFCEEPCSANFLGAGTVSLCVWCQRKVHNDCLTESPREGEGKVCDLGDHRRLIIPPGCVTSTGHTVTALLEAVLGSGTMRSGRKTPKGQKKGLSHNGAFGSVADFRRKEAERVAVNGGDTKAANLKHTIGELPQDCRPLLVFVNKRSGAQHGAHLRRRFNRLLNPLQVWELSAEQGPEVGLKLFENVKHFSVLVCGGDGTVGWVMDAIESKQYEFPPPIAVCPLGTGNDLARVLNWGGGYGAIKVPGGLHTLLQDLLDRAAFCLLDRWQLTIRDPAEGKESGPGRVVATKYMNNYMGVGCDAKIALDVHSLREESPELFYSQLVNKFWYTKEGAKTFLEQSCADLPWDLHVELDGQPLDIPDGVEGLVLLNIPSFMGGVDLWQSQEEHEDPLAPQAMHDKVIEVVGIYSVLHLGRLQIGLSRALRLGQARRVRLRTSAALPFQVDGEPWLQAGPACIEVTHHSQAFMLRRSAEEAGGCTPAIVQDVLEAAESRGIIHGGQRKQLLQDLALRLHH